MSGYVKRPVAQEYLGEYKLGGATKAKNGMFVTVDHPNKEVDIPSDDATGELYFVENVIVREIPHGYDDKDFEIAVGEFVRRKPIISTEHYITDQVTANALAGALGTELGAGADGKLGTIADLTAADFTGFKHTFTIIEKTKLMGVDALVVQAK